MDNYIRENWRVSLEDFMENADEATILVAFDRLYATDWQKNCFHIKETRLQLTSRSFRQYLLFDSDTIRLSTYLIRFH